MKDTKATRLEGDVLDIDTGLEKWRGQQVGVNSNVPLIDEGSGSKYIIRQFEFAFNPAVVRQIQQKKIPAPTKQELFNSNWNQIRIMLWGDGLVAIEEAEFPPRIIISKKKYRIILVCMPRLGTTVIHKPQTLQEITKPK